jgi:hypothetical protein
MLPHVGKAIEAWEQILPSQLKMIDPKKNEVVQYLFMYRTKPGSHTTFIGYASAMGIPVIPQAHLLRL